MVRQPHSHFLPAIQRQFGPMVALFWLLGQGEEKCFESREAVGGALSLQLKFGFFTHSVAANLGKPQQHFPLIIVVVTRAQHRHGYQTGIVLGRHA